MQNRTLMCYGEGREDRWEMVCLDLDIAAQGRSLPDAMARLQEAIHLHVEYIMSLPPKEQRRFWLRRAPMSLRFKFLWHTLRSHWRRGGKNDKQRAEILLPCNA